MKLKNFEVGERIRHPARPEWGPGEVLGVSEDGKVTVYFALVGQKTLKGVAFERLTGAEASHPLLEHRIRTADRGAKTRSIADLKAAFLRLFPGGFEDPHYLESERNYKIAASELLVRTMDAATLSRLLADGEYSEINKRALAIVNKTNLIFPNEKMDLKGGLARAGAPQLFAHALNDLLHGPSDYETRFTSFIEVLGQIDAAKWTIATYFPFLADRQHQMFLKPGVTKHAALACANTVRASSLPFGRGWPKHWTCVT